MSTCTKEELTEIVDQVFKIIEGELDSYAPDSLAISYYEKDCMLLGPGNGMVLFSSVIDKLMEVRKP